VLCIDATPGDQRFKVEVNFSTAQSGGLLQDAKAIPLAPLGISSGGIFYFFSKDNPEILIKILDGCALTKHYWVFLSAVTNVGFRTTVTDMTTSERFVYVNESLTVAVPVQDVHALPCLSGGVSFSTSVENG